jgi:hypothetical protein
MDYAKADALLQGRCKARRKVANNTYLERRQEGVIALKLHATDVLTFIQAFDALPERVKYDTGGWRTVTTKERLNRFGAAGVYVSSNRGIWYASGEASVVVFNEGMIWDGETFHGAKSQDEEKAEKKERRDVKKFAKRYLDSLEAGKVEAPGPGDCWYCSLQAQGGLTLGEVQGDTTHLREHVKESYFVPSLLSRAVFNEWSGASQSMKHWVASFWQDDEAARSGRQWGERDRVEKALRKYLLKSLGHAA